MSSYPPQWQHFLRDVFLKSEGGYFFSGGIDNLFGVIDRVWAEEIPKIPQAEIDRQPTASREQLERIRHAAPGDRMALARAWMHSVGRETAAFGGGSQPESGRPMRSKEWAEPGGNQALVAASQDLALGIIYREYMLNSGFSDLPVDDKNLFTIVDAGARHGVPFAYGMLGRAIVDSGIVTEPQLNGALLNSVERRHLAIRDEGERNLLGHVISLDLPKGSQYAATKLKDGEGKPLKDERGYELVSAKPGYPYGTQAGWRAIADLLKDVTPQQNAMLFDAYGKWRRTFITNQPNKDIVDGELTRIALLHGNPSLALQRMNAYHEGGLAAYQTVAGQQESGEPIRPAHGLPNEALDNSILVQTATQYPGFNVSPNDIGRKFVYLQLPQNMGTFAYTVKYEEGWVANKDNPKKAERRIVPLVDEYSLPKDVEFLRKGERSADKTFTNTFDDSPALHWRDPKTGKPSTFVIGPADTEMALERQENRLLAGWLPGNDKSIVIMDGQEQLDPAYSAKLGFNGAHPEQAKSWSSPVAAKIVAIEMTSGPVEAPQIKPASLNAPSANGRSGGRSGPLR